MILKGNKKRFLYTLILFFVCLLTLSEAQGVIAKAMPFYSLSPKFLTIRSTFSTYYENSSSERKSNIRLATKAIDGYILDVGAEFSFNQVVGPRTEKRGYKRAKIIVGGEFVDGVGGGVCQVSTTLYNVVLLAGLPVVECHAHSLPVSYVKPSTDAMVNSGSADLRFVNNTNNPIIVRATANGEKLTIKIIGEPLKVEYRLESETLSKIPAPDYIIVKDDKGEYPDLYEGERLYLSYSKDGLKSSSLLVKYKDGVVVEKIRLRTDTYKAVQGKVIVGTTPRPTLDEEKDTLEGVFFVGGERGIALLHFAKQFTGVSNLCFAKYFGQPLKTMGVHRFLNVLVRIPLIYLYEQKIPNRKWFRIILAEKEG